MKFPLRVTNLIFLFSFATLTFFLCASAGASPQRYFNLEADLPADWHCQREDADFVCLNESQDNDKSAAVVITVRQRAPQDSFDFFKQQLSRPRTLEFQGLPMTSQVKEVREREINGLLWNEGIHFGSEIMGYFTHYLVTTDETTSVLIAISVHQDDHEKIYSSLGPFIQSLKLIPADSKSPSHSAIVRDFGKNHIRSLNDSYLIGGVRFRKIHLIAAGAAIFALILMGYAIFSD